MSLFDSMSIVRILNFYIKILKNKNVDKHKQTFYNVSVLKGCDIMKNKNYKNRDKGKRQFGWNNES